MFSPNDDIKQKFFNKLQKKGWNGVLGSFYLYDSELSQIVWKKVRGSCMFQDDFGVFNISMDFVLTL